MQEGPQYKCGGCKTLRPVSNFPRKSLIKRKGRWHAKKGKKPSCETCRSAKKDEARACACKGACTPECKDGMPECEDATPTLWMRPIDNMPSEYAKNLSGPQPKPNYDQAIDAYTITCDCKEVFKERDCIVNDAFAHPLRKLDILDTWRVHRRRALACTAYPRYEHEKRWRERIIQTLRILPTVMHKSERLKKPARFRIHSQHWLYRSSDPTAFLKSDHISDNEYEPLLKAIEEGLRVIGWMNVEDYENNPKFDEHDIIEIVIQTLKRREVMRVSDI